MEQKNKWEIKFVNNPYYYNRRLVIMITGYSFQEVTDVTGQAERWYSRKFKESFRALGFNCSERFIKFDPDTERPAILRSVSSLPEESGGWFASVYYDGKVYVPGTGIFTLQEHTEQFPHLKNSSMLEVWI